MPADEKPPSPAGSPEAPPSSQGRAGDLAPAPDAAPAGDPDAPAELPEAFVALASHELRTPLQAMSLQVEIMRARLARSPGDVSTPWMLERLDRIGKLVQRSAHLIENMLSVSGMALGQHALRRETLDLAELARDVLATNADSLRWAGCRCTLHAAGALLGSFDRSRIERALENLLGNAMKYAAGTAIEVAVWAEGPDAFLRVKDQGPGIAPAEHQRIFERFVRGGRTSSVEGFGLGLWIVKTIAEEHGGSVAIVSAPGAGAAFTLRLPLA